jgi:hypothetical protein
VRECRWAVATSSARAHPLAAFAPWTSRSTDNLQLVGGVIESLTSAPRGTSVIVGVDDVHITTEAMRAAFARYAQTHDVCLTKSNLRRVNGYSEKNY